MHTDNSAYPGQLMHTRHTDTSAYLGQLMAHQAHRHQVIAGAGEASVFSSSMDEAERLRRGAWRRQCDGRLLPAWEDTETGSSGSYAWGYKFPVTAHKHYVYRQ
eukprot:1159756-Pelagomonas_calceolata.AAC.2